MHFCVLVQATLDGDKNDMHIRSYFRQQVASVVNDIERPGLQGFQTWDTIQVIARKLPAIYMGPNF